MEESIQPLAPVVVRLKNPIRLGSQTIDELTFRELEAGDMALVGDRQIGDISWGLILKLAGRLSGQSDQVISKLRGKDIGAVVAVTTAFFLAAHATGDEP